ncbi:MAG TPA: hypothetical protein VM533_14700 [Fimbriiglobus sp.]|nr:hypothetical protein [Fimbriiglobus sp.]
MGWEKRGGASYYYTAQRAGGRVAKLYVGSGPVAEYAALLEAENRAERRHAAEAARRERDELAALDTALAPLDELADALTAAALVAAGYHRHHRGPWRKRRA